MDEPIDEHAVFEKREHIVLHSLTQRRLHRPADEVSRRDARKWNVLRIRVQPLSQGARRHNTQQYAALRRSTVRRFCPCSVLIGAPPPYILCFAVTSLSQPLRMLRRQRGLGAFLHSASAV